MTTIIIRKTEQVHQKYRDNKIKNKGKTKKYIDDLIDNIWKILVTDKNGNVRAAIVSNKWQEPNDYSIHQPPVTINTFSRRKQQTSLTDLSQIDDDDDESNTNTNHNNNHNRNRNHNSNQNQRESSVDIDADDSNTLHKIKTKLANLMRKWRKLQDKEKKVTRLEIYTLIDTAFKNKEDDPAFDHITATLTTNEDTPFLRNLIELGKKEQWTKSRKKQYNVDKDNNWKYLEFTNIKALNEFCRKTVKQKKKPKTKTKTKSKPKKTNTVRSKASIKPPPHSPTNASSQQRNKRKYNKPDSNESPTNTISETATAIRDGTMTVKQTKLPTEKVNPRFVKDTNLLNQNGPYATPPIRINNESGQFSIVCSA